MAREKELKLSVSHDPDLTRWVRTDPVRLRQVLVNLVGNAIKFTEHGFVELTVEMLERTPIDHEKQRFRFAVRDSGPGISSEEIPALFDAFKQGRAGARMKDGSGLGLAISRGFVELMGGRLELESRVGVGTTVRFELPLVRLLSPIGFHLREAGDGLEAVEAWQTWSPHVICMDERMPVLTGREAARRIKASPGGHSTLIVALTASGFDEDHADLRAAGFDAFLIKPYSETELLRLLQRHLNFRFAHDATRDAIPS